MSFSWIVTDQVGAMSQPWPEELPRLRERGITHVIALTERMSDDFEEVGMSALHLPVRDFSPPTQEQLAAAVDYIDAALAGNGRVAVHCGAGLGRTGTVCAAWLVSLGRTPPDAIAEVRRRRQGAIETRGQAGAVAAFVITLRGRSS